MEKLDTSWFLMNDTVSSSVIVTVVIISIMVMTYLLVFDSTSHREHGG